MRSPSLFVWVLVATAGAAAAVASRPSKKQHAPLPVAQSLGQAHLELPEDPPGVPARPVPGAQPSAPIRMASFTAYQVNVDSNGANIPGDAANEPSIAIDPIQPNRMAIGWRQFDTVNSNFRQAGRGYSHDGGRTWTFPGVLDPGVFRSDPVLASDASGRFDYDSLEVTSSYLCDVYESSDHGVSWPTSAPAFGGDKAWMTIDATASPGAGNVYECWSVFAGCCGNSTFTRSTDGGQTFLNPLPIPNEPIWGTLDVASNGILFIGGVSPQNSSVFPVARSSNAQNSGVTPSFDLSTNVNLGGSLVGSQGSGTPNPGGLLGQVNIAVDRSSGPTAGWVYLLCSVDPSGADPLDVHFVRSTDHGATWSTPRRVNDDAPNSGAWQWFGTMSVAPNGRIDVVWNDTRNTGQVNLCQLYYSFSTDGGTTWSPNQALTPVWDSYVGWPNQSKIGDYYHMVSDSVGADLAFAATFNGEQDVYYMRIGDHDCNRNGIGDAIDIASGTSQDANGDGIPDECECVTETYCVGAPNSAGPGASIGSTGALSISANGFNLTASGCPANRTGLFFYGRTRVQVPFGNGFRCVGGSIFRLNPALTTSSTGTALRHLDFTQPPANGGPGHITPFSTWNFQLWYRDPAAGGANTNASNGLSATFCP